MEILGHIFFSGDSNILDQLQRIEILHLVVLQVGDFRRGGVVEHPGVLGGCDLTWNKNTKHPSGSNSLNR